MKISYIVRPLQINFFKKVLEGRKNRGAMCKIVDERKFSCDDKIRKRGICGSLIVAISLLTISSCQFYKERYKPELEKGSPITLLHQKIDDSKANNARLYFPTSLEQAEDKLKESTSNYDSIEDKSKSDSLAREGIQILENGQRDKKEIMEFFSGTYDARNKAISASANSNFKDDFLELDNQLMQAAKYFQNKQHQKAKSLGMDLKDKYLDLENKSLEFIISFYAEKSILKAKENGAGEFSPKTLANAKKELEIAKKIIKSNSDNRVDAVQHAILSRQISDRSNYIAQLAKTFENLNYTNEDIIIWYQTNLTKVSEPLILESNYDQDNEKVINNIKDSITSLKSTLTSSISNLKEVNQKLLAEKSAEDRDEMILKIISASFEKDEAEIYKQPNKLIIKAYGFYYNVGDSTVKVSNFDLTRKIVNAINMYPEFKTIIISGHTDSTGSEELNKKLSIQRAKTVKELLIEMGGISPYKIEVAGYGETKPLYSNDNKKGRSLNRRIEIEIIF